MEGFKSIWSDNVGCVVLFNSSWVLDSRFKFLAAFFGIFIMGTMSEAIFGDPLGAIIITPKYPKTKTHLPPSIPYTYYSVRN